MTINPRYPRPDDPHVAERRLNRLRTLTQSSLRDGGKYLARHCGLKPTSKFIGPFKKIFLPPAIPSRFFACLIERLLRRRSSQQKISATENGLPFHVRERGRMDFIKHISHSLMFAARGDARRRHRLAAGALFVAAASLAQFFYQSWQPRRAAGAQAAALQGEAAVRRLKTDCDSPATVTANISNRSRRARSAPTATASQ